jgi:hypothetical protein
MEVPAIMDITIRSRSRAVAQPDSKGRPVQKLFRIRAIINHAKMAELATHHHTTGSLDTTIAAVQLGSKDETAQKLNQLKLPDHAV